MIAEERYTIKKLSIPDNMEHILLLIKQLNPDTSEEHIKVCVTQMFQFDNYQCIGFYDEDKLVGLTSCWTLVKIYSGKQLEVDNVIIDSSMQSKGYGKLFFKILEDWAKQNDYTTIELNTYADNYRSHKFYFNQGYIIKGYHFQKHI